MEITLFYDNPFDWFLRLINSKEIALLEKQFGLTVSVPPDQTDVLSLVFSSDILGWRDDNRKIIASMIATLIRDFGYHQGTLLRYVGIRFSLEKKNNIPLCRTIVLKWLLDFLHGRYTYGSFPQGEVEDFTFSLGRFLEGKYEDFEGDPSISFSEIEDKTFLDLLAAEVYLLVVHMHSAYVEILNLGV